MKVGTVGEQGILDIGERFEVSWGFGEKGVGLLEEGKGGIGFEEEFRCYLMKGEKVGEKKVVYQR